MNGIAVFREHKIIVVLIIVTTSNCCRIKLFTYTMRGTGYIIRSHKILLIYTWLVNYNSHVPQTFRNFLRNRC